jgi:hypothetical protein
MSDRPDMVVRSIEGDRWGELGQRMTPEQREEAVDALITKLTARYTWFDRDLCPCGAMHERYACCGLPVDHCPLTDNTEGDNP